MAFLIKDELRTKSQIEIIDAITQADDTIIDMIISENITYMKGYLNSRYDVTKVFSQTGDNRDQVVLKILKALVIYEIYASNNPNMMTQTIKDENEQAIRWLELVQRTKVNPDLPALVDSSNNPVNDLSYGSNLRRENHY